MASPVLGDPPIGGGGFACTKSGRSCVVVPRRRELHTPMESTFADQLRDFYESHRRELYAYAVTLTRERAAAEDAIHTAFERLLRRGCLPGELRPYVFRSVRNAAVDELRRGRRHSGDGAFAGEPEAAAPSVTSGGELSGLLARLGGDERETIVLKVFDSLTFREIAEVRGVSVNTAASWYRRGLEKLRELLAKEAA